MSETSKIRDRAFGQFAEDRAAEYYIKEGYAIRERNWHFHRIEIDIIAQKREYNSFCGGQSEKRKGYAT